MRLTKSEIRCKIIRCSIINCYLYINNQRQVFMKKSNKKLIIPMLAVMLGAAAIGGVNLGVNSVSADEPKTYSVTEIFVASEKASVSAKKIQAADEKYTTAFTLENGATVRFKNDLALKWFERAALNAGEDNASYFTVKFAFDELNFDGVEFVMESEASIATEDDKAVNSVKFSKTGDKYYLSVCNGETEDVKKEILLAAKTEYSLSFAKGEETDEFKVLFNGEVIKNDVAEDDGSYREGAFKNIGSNYVEYAYGEMHPLTVKATTSADAKATVFLTELNHQAFDEVTQSEKSENSYLVTDTAAPILVVNEGLNGFQLGNQFTLSYTRIDVLQTSLPTETKEYYMYNPAVEDATYKTLSTSTYFMDTVYYVNDSNPNEYSASAKEGYSATSVYQENGEEYVAIRYTLKDTAGNSKEYDLAWYNAYESVEKIGEKDYIVVGRSEKGASYSYITADESSKTNIVDRAKLEAKMENFKAALEKAAEGVYAGSNSYIKFPSFAWFINDDNGYRNLKFTISYKKPSSTSASTSSSLSPSDLKLAAAEEGEYEFKIFANDKAGNTMMYYLNNELVSVTSSNVWDIEEIPSFTYKIKNQGLKVEEKASDRKVSKILDQTYSLSGVTVVGATNQKSQFALYRVNLDKYNNTVTAASSKISTSMLSAITYADVQKEVKGKILSVTDEKYFELYKTAYATLLADKVGADVNKVLPCFEEIQKYDERITEDDAEWEQFNKYKWQPDSQSFVTAEEGEYLIFCDYWEEELPMQRAVAYKLISVASETDVIKGETDWLKNNLVSVILFAIAGVMLILIIILLLVNPSDETLEDLDEKDEKKDEEDKK